jgi:alpha-beta hydrolase superfamily lysophospholipase
MVSNFFKSSNGLQLRTNTWLIDNAKADIFFVHGFGEHSKRYFSEAQYFNSLGFNFYAYDQRTHGESEGKTRAYIDDFNLYINEFGEFLQHFECGKKRPFFLMSHSMGGLVLLSYLINSKERKPNYLGCAFSSPFLMPNKDTAPLLQKIAGIVAIFAPKLKTVKIDAKEISRDPKEQQSYINDPLNYHDGIYAKTGASLLKQMKKIKPFFNTFKDPFIIQHGTIDQLAEFQGSQSLYDDSQSTDKTFIPLEGYKHEITRDIDFGIVRDNFGKWMEARIKE